MVFRSTSRARVAPVLLTHPAEFAAFYREHLPFVRLYLARRIDDPFLVADLTAEVFLRVIRSAGSYRSELAPPRAWLTGIARHSSLTGIARHSSLTTNNQRPAKAPQPVACTRGGCSTKTRPTGSCNE